MDDDSKGPVDVLGTLGRIRDWGLSGGRQWYDMPEATDAVAELLAAAEEVNWVYEDRHANEFFHGYERKFKRLVLAAARVRGEAQR